MSKVRYVGPHASGVEVVMPGGQEDIFVEHGGILETTAEHAEALLDQPSNWEPVKGSKKVAKDA